MAHHLMVLQGRISSHIPSSRAHPRRITVDHSAVSYPRPLALHLLPGGVRAGGVGVAGGKMVVAAASGGAEAVDKTAVATGGEGKGGDGIQGEHSLHTSCDFLKRLRLG